MGLLSWNYFPFSIFCIFTTFYKIKLKKKKKKKRKKKKEKETKGFSILHSFHISRASVFPTRLHVRPAKTDQPADPRSLISLPCPA